MNENKTITSNQNVLIRSFDDNLHFHIFDEFDGGGKPGIVLPARPIKFNADSSIDDSVKAAYTKAGKPPKTPKDYIFNIWNLMVVPLCKNDPNEDPDFVMGILYDKATKSMSMSMFNPDVKCADRDIILLHRSNESLIQEKFNKSFDEMKGILGLDSQTQFQECFMQGFDLSHLVNLRLCPHLIYFDEDGNGTSICKFKRNTNLNKVYEDIPTWYDLNNNYLDLQRNTSLIKGYSSNGVILFKKPMYYNLSSPTQWSSVRTVSLVQDVVTEQGTITENNEVRFEDIEAVKKEIKEGLVNEMLFRSQF